MKQEVTTLVVSLASLVQFGTKEEGEIAQRAIKHAAFRSYREGKLSRGRAIAQIASSYNVESEAIDKIFKNICNHCEVDEALMSACTRFSASHTVKLILWNDLPSEELEMINPKFPATIFWQQLSTPLTSTSFVEKQNTVIITHELERASLLNSKGWKAVPYTHLTKTSCLAFFRRLQLPLAIRKGTEALENAIETSQMRSFIEAGGKKLFMLEYFAPVLALSAQDPLRGKVPIRNSTFSSLLATLTSAVTSGKAFGFCGFDFRHYRPDCDTMSLNASVLCDQGLISKQQASAVLDMLLANLDPDGVLLVYLDPSRPRIDIAVLVNVIFLAYLVGRESEPVVQRQEQLVREFLLGQGYLWGTLYYPHPEAFLHYYGRLLRRFGPRIEGYQQLLEALKDGVMNRSGESTSSPLDVAKRVLLCSMFGMRNWVDKELLLQMQREDGSWPVSDVYALPTTKGSVYNEVVDLCFILTALAGDFPCV